MFFENHFALVVCDQFQLASYTQVIAGSVKKFINNSVRKQNIIDIRMTSLISSEKYQIVIAYTYNAIGYHILTLFIFPFHFFP